jgi:hypothetical protein
MAEVASWPGVTVERIAVASHEFRPIWSQTQARAALERALERELTQDVTATADDSSASRGRSGTQETQTVAARDRGAR